MFADYISNVLPELGEETVPETSMEQILSGVLDNKYKCQSDLWNVKEYKVEGKTSEAAFTNDTLNQIKARLNQIYFQQSLCDGDVTPEMIKDIYTGVAYSKRHLISYFSIHNENFRK